MACGNVHIAQDEHSADSESGVLSLANSIKPRDKAGLNPLQNCYIAITEGFASLKKELQFITPYLF